MKKLLIVLSILALTACSTAQQNRQYRVSRALVSPCENIPSFLDAKPKTMAEYELHKQTLLDMYQICWFKQNELGYFTKLNESDELNKMRRNRS